MSQSIHSRQDQSGPPAPPRPASSVALIGFGLAGLGALALVMAGPGHRSGLWDYPTGFSILRWAAYGGLGAAAVSLLGGVLARPGGPRRGLAFAILGLVLGLAVTAVPWNYRQTARGVPPIHDITTDVENPPRFKAVLPLRAKASNPAEYGGPAIAVQQLRAYPDIRPATLVLSPDQAFERALAGGREMGGTIIDAAKAEGRNEATDETFWFGFRDDVVIRITPAAGTGSRVDVRSASRVGRSDLGKNAQRIRAFLERLAKS